MVVRVLRFLEYVYADHEAAEKDMQNWAVPANGTTRKGGGRNKKYYITSATMFPRTIAVDEEILSPNDGLLPGVPEDNDVRPTDFYHGG